MKSHNVEVKPQDFMAGIFVFAIFASMIIGYVQPQPIDYYKLHLNNMQKLREKVKRVDQFAIPYSYSEIELENSGENLTIYDKKIEVDFAMLKTASAINGLEKPMLAINWEARLDVPLEQLGVKGYLRPIFKEDDNSQLATFAGYNQTLSLPLTAEALTDEQVNSSIMEINTAKHHYSAITNTRRKFLFPETDFLNLSADEEYVVSLYMNGRQLIPKSIYDALEHSYMIKNFYLDNQMAVYTLAAVDSYRENDFTFREEDQIIIFHYLPYDAVYVQIPTSLFLQKKEFDNPKFSSAATSKRAVLVVVISVLALSIGLFYYAHKHQVLNSDNKGQKRMSLKLKKKTAKHQQSDYDDYHQSAKDAKLNNKQQFDTKNKNGPYWIDED